MSSRAEIAIGVWAFVVALGVGVGLALKAFHRHIVLPTPPILAHIATAPRPGIVIPIGVAALLIVRLPEITARIRWRTLCSVVTSATLAWTLALALAEGTSGLTRGPSWSTEYLPDVPVVRSDPVAFLRGFTDNISRYQVHVRGHPPGFVLLLAGLDRIGLGGAGGEAVVVIGIAITAPLAVLLALRDVVGESTARRCAPWLVLAPAAIWVATSADALYMAVSAWSVTLVVLAMSRRGPIAWLLALVGGVVGGLALLGSYGLVLVATVPIAIGWRLRCTDRASRGQLARTTGLAVFGVLVVLIAMLPLGYSWLDGLRATKHEYDILDLDRPYWAFLVINLAAWALALGPAMAAALARLGRSALAAIVCGGLAAAALANLSGLSEGEVERIWLPFTIWVLPAGAALATTQRTTRRWLTVQAASAIVLISIVTTQW